MNQLSVISSALPHFILSADASTSMSTGVYDGDLKKNFVTSNLLKDAVSESGKFSKEPFDLVCTESLGIPYNPLNFYLDESKEVTNKKSVQSTSSFQEENTQSKRTSTCSVQCSQGESPSLLPYTP